MGKDSSKKTDPVDVVVDVEDEGDDGPHEAHVADGVRAAGHALALDVLTLFAFRLKLKISETCHLRILAFQLNLFKKSFLIIMHKQKVSPGLRCS